MPSALIIGASRGIGLEFARQYLAADWRVFGTFRGQADRIGMRRVIGEPMAYPGGGFFDYRGQSLAW